MAGIGGRKAVRRLFGGNTATALRCEETAAPDADGIVRTVHDVRNELAAGTYELTLRITHDGRSIERTRTLHIAER